MRLVAIVLAEILSVFALLLVAGSGPWSGPRLLTVTTNHGIHAVDILVLGLWLVGMGCCFYLWRIGNPTGDDAGS